MKAHKVVDNVGKFIVDSMLVILLLALLALPASSVSLLKVQPGNQQVLSSTSQTQTPQEFNEESSSYRPEVDETTDSVKQLMEENR